MCLLVSKKKYTNWDVKCVFTNLWEESRRGIQRWRLVGDREDGCRRHTDRARTRWRVSTWRYQGPDRDLWLSRSWGHFDKHTAKPMADERVCCRRRGVPPIPRCGGSFDTTSDREKERSIGCERWPWPPSGRRIKSYLT